MVRYSLAFGGFLKEVDISALGVKHRLSVEVVFDNSLAAICTDAQTNSCDFVSVMVLHIVRFDVGHFAIDGVLYRVDVPQLATTVNLVEMLGHVAVDDLFGIDDLTVDALVGGAFHADGGQLFLEIGHALLLLRDDDFNVVGGVGGEDEVDRLEADENSSGQDLFHGAFKEEVP